MDSLLRALLPLLPKNPEAFHWLAVTFALLCVLSYFRAGSRNDVPRKQRLAAALAKGAAFAGLALLAYLLMHTSYQSFQRVYASFTSGGSLSNQAWERWFKLYGQQVTQRSLEVIHYVPVTKLEQFPADTPDGADQYVQVQEEEPLEQNSITAFTGQVTMNLVSPHQQANSYNAYALTALYEYEISNRSDQQTRAVFRFPLDNDSRPFRDISIRINGEERKDWSLNLGTITWDDAMQPGQVDQVAIQYVTWGMNGYTYVVENTYESTNFQLSLAFDTDHY